MGTAPIELTGTLHGLQRKIGKIGGEVVSLSISSKDLEKWSRLVAHAEQTVKISLLPVQDNLPGLDGAKGGKGKKNGKRDLPRGVKAGSKAADGSHQAQD